MDAHKSHVSAIADTIRYFHSLKTPFRISHGSTNSTRPTSSTRSISTANLDHVLAINTNRLTCIVEPNVPMDRLVLATLEHGLIPPVVMEFPGITVGGGYSGTSGESSSFRHGFFNETLNWVELVLGDGEVVYASRKERPDLFWGASSACGTLGVVTLVEIRLVPAKTFVRVMYHPVFSVEEAVTKIKECTKNKEVDYVDGVLFSESSGAVITGVLTDADTEEEKRLTIQTFTEPSDPWYYMHVHSLLPNSPSLKAASQSELVPIYSYLFRYDRAAFWVARHAFAYFLFPFTSLTRWFLDDFCRTRMLYKALHASGQSERYFVQDLAVPYENAEEFIRWTSAQTGIWPLWLCPLKGDDEDGVAFGEDTFHPITADDRGRPRDMLNIGLWGEPYKHHLRSTEIWTRLNQALEAKLNSLGGRKWLYAHSYYSQRDFEEIYASGAGSWYNRLRMKYRAKSLPSVWEKVVRSGTEGRSWIQRVVGVWPVAGIYGLWVAIRSGEYLKARRVGWDRGGWLGWSRVHVGGVDGKKNA